MSRAVTSHRAWHPVILNSRLMYFDLIEIIKR